jgi:hypothetical protein
VRIVDDALMRFKRGVVGGLNTLCTAVDGVAYRPAVVRLTLRLPRWWRCDLARLSMRLDSRWGIGYWSSDSTPPAPSGLCDACGRRAAWLVVGGREWLEDLEPDHSFMEEHPVRLCGWCRLSDLPATIDSQEQLLDALAAARATSVAWRWS